MKTFDVVMATTHVDLHGTRFTRDSLEQAAADLNSRFIPLLHEHDLLRPLGRILGGTVRQRDDGEWELVAQAEMLESGDLAAPLHPGREFRPSPPDEVGLHVYVGDEFIRDPNSRRMLPEFESLLGRPVQLEGRRALEPPDLVKLAGIYLVGKVAEGFLTGLGADGYAKLKGLITRLFNTRPGEQKQRRVYVDLFFEREGVEVILIQSDPTPERLDAMLSRGLEELDAILPELLSSLPDTRRIVAEYGTNGVRIAYVMGSDCLARETHRT